MSHTVVILGAGINGCALARELALNGVGVRLVDEADIGGGATARSSRLIHGGLRYLEYGDFKLVRESLAERSRLLSVAPQFVRPLSLAIPVARRTGGLFRAGMRFLGVSRTGIGRWFGSQFGKPGSRGLWCVETGLGMYDRFDDDPRFPSHRVDELDGKTTPRVDRGQYRWVCRYSDGQMLYPERFVVALLHDARQAAAERDVAFDVQTYHRARVAGDAIAIHPVDDEAATTTIKPSLLVNATGAWGDWTLKELGVPSRRLFGGTKGSHIVTFHSGIREALGSGGVYAEADDGRLVFVLPFGDGVLVGTTDVRFEERPESAVAAGDEIDYLLEMVNDLFPQVKLTTADVALHYSGVRPLPYTPAGKAGAISRGHWVESHPDAAFPAISLVGGKLTTGRAFAEEVADVVFTRLGVERSVSTQERVVPGGEDYPDEQLQGSRLAELAASHSSSVEAVRRLWSLFGTLTSRILKEAAEIESSRESCGGIPAGVVRWVIRHEWVDRLEDLIERRLLLLFGRELNVDHLRQAAACLVREGRLPGEGIEPAVEAARRRLRELYGREV